MNQTRASAYGTSVMIEISKEKRDQKMSINKFQEIEQYIGGRERERGQGSQSDKDETAGGKNHFLARHRIKIRRY